VTGACERRAASMGEIISFQRPARRVATLNSFCPSQWSQLGKWSQLSGWPGGELGLLCCSAAARKRRQAAGTHCWPAAHSLRANSLCTQRAHRLCAAAHCSALAARYLCNRRGGGAGERRDETAHTQPRQVSERERERRAEGSETERGGGELAGWHKRSPRRPRRSLRNKATTKARPQCSRGPRVAGGQRAEGGERRVERSEPESQRDRRTERLGGRADLGQGWKSVCWRGTMGSV